MEAFVALGIACNILQLISCGLKVATLSKELHEKGSTGQYDDIKENATQMGKISRQLEQQLSNSSSHGNLTRDHTDLVKLAAKCREVSDQLQQETAKLTLDPKQRGRRRALSTSVKSIIRQGSIENLEKQLHEQRDALQTQLQVDSYVQQEASLLRQSEGFTDIDRGLQKLVNDIAAGSVDLSKLIINKNADLVALIRSEALQGRQDVKSRIELANTRAKYERQRELVLQSLTFTEINDRINSVPESHRETFEWMFDRTAQHSWDSFTDWLENGQDMYWISGKPGSGKSVLMKFLFEHEQTSKLLSKWAAGEQVIKLHFFIWKAGSTMQKQKKGLLCTLARQLLKHCEAFLLSTLRSGIADDRLTTSDWSEKELSALIENFSKTRPEKLCIFIDGLDESEDRHGDVGLLEQVRWLQALQNVKLCVSSRPEPEFRLALAKCPQLKLQDLTEGDLKRFATDKLREAGDLQFPDESNRSSVPQQLVDIVLSKADGVFLWVRVAIASVIRGIQRMDGWDDLMKRLDRLPTKLLDLYADMWERNADDFEDYREEAGLYFRWTLAADSAGLSCFDLMIATSDVAHRIFDQADFTFTRERLNEECQRTEQRTLNCCVGLLESFEKKDRGRLRVISSRRENCPDDTLPTQLKNYRMHHIQFIHRTAIDFIQKTPTGQSILKCSIPDNEEYKCLKLSASAVAPYYEFPTVDLVILVYICRDADSTRTQRQQRMCLEVFETLHEKLAAEVSKSNDFDILRDWISFVERGGSYRGSNLMPFLLETINPCRYAVGWRSLLVTPGVKWYLDQKLLPAHGCKISREYATCLAMCAAASDIGSPAERLKLINRLAENGADVNMKLPVKFGWSSLADPYSYFFARMMDKQGFRDFMGREEMQQQLQTVATSVENLSNTLVHILQLKPANSDELGEFVMLSPGECGLLRSKSLSDTRLWVVEFNLAALVELCCHSIGLSQAQISTILQAGPDPQCLLIAIEVDEGKFRAPANDSEAPLFYRHLVQCGDAAPLAEQRDDKRRQSKRETPAIKKLYQVAREIEHRATTDLNLDQELESRGYWHPGHITPSDVPLLDPFGEKEVDCSKFMPGFGTS